MNESGVPLCVLRLKQFEQSAISLLSGFWSSINDSWDPFWFIFEVVWKNLGNPLFCLWSTWSEKISGILLCNWNESGDLSMYSFSINLKESRGPLEFCFWYSLKESQWFLLSGFWSILKEFRSPFLSGFCSNLKKSQSTLGFLFLKWFERFLGIPCVWVLEYFERVSDTPRLCFLK